jgi:hypothetical protein
LFKDPIFGSGHPAIDFAAAKPEVVVRVGYHSVQKWGALSPGTAGTTWVPFASLP